VFNIRNIESTHTDNSAEYVGPGSDQGSYERKKELIGALSAGADLLETRIETASQEFNRLEHRLSHEIIYTFTFTAIGIRQRYSSLEYTVTHPEAFRQYSSLRPFKKAKARQATKRATQLLDAVNIEQLEECKEALDIALDNNTLEDDIVYVARVKEQGMEPTVTEDEYRAMVRRSSKVFYFFKPSRQLFGALEKQGFVLL
jgi:hypothetical protein